MRLGDLSTHPRKMLAMRRSMQLLAMRRSIQLLISFILRAVSPIHMTTSNFACKLAVPHTHTHTHAQRIFDGGQVVCHHHGHHWMWRTSLSRGCASLLAEHHAGQHATCQSRCKCSTTSDSVKFLGWRSRQLRACKDTLTHQHAKPC